MVCLEFHDELFFPLVVFAENQGMWNNFYVVLDINLHTHLINEAMH